MSSRLSKKSESPSHLRVERDSKELDDFWCKFLSNTNKLQRNISDEDIRGKCSKFNMQFIKLLICKITFYNSNRK